MLIKVTLLLFACAVALQLVCADISSEVDVFDVNDNTRQRNARNIFLRSFDIPSNVSEKKIKFLFEINFINL
jgi:hypothetical protein